MEHRIEGPPRMPDESVDAYMARLDGLKWQRYRDEARIAKARRSIRVDERQAVTITRARCPHCGSHDLQSTRTTQLGSDEAVMRDTVCRICKTKFPVFVE